MSVALLTQTDASYSDREERLDLVELFVVQRDSDVQVMSALKLHPKPSFSVGYRSRISVAK
jgi:hypothetical protein